MNQQIADNMRSDRTKYKFSLDYLANKYGCSKSMAGLICQNKRYFNEQYATAQTKEDAKDIASWISLWLLQKQNPNLSLEDALGMVFNEEGE